jgi:hypothetical protein
MGRRRYVFPHQRRITKEFVVMKAIVVETDKEVEVERGEPTDNPWGWHSQMWLTDKEGNMYHEDELIMI